MRKAEWFDIDEKHNTYVYVTGLPATIKEEDFVDLMKRFGVIAKKALPGQPNKTRDNVKLYKNSDGSLKGDALCCYAKPESVDLALKLLDEYQYDESHVLHCERAKFELKGSYDPQKKPRLDPKAKASQKKVVEKLLSWEVPESGTSQKVVILKNMFTPAEIAEDPSLLIDLKDDIGEKCQETKCQPKKIEVHDLHPEGVIAVTLASHEQAQVFVGALNNEFYAGRLVTAELWDGHTKYKIRETEEESQARLEKWQQDLMKNKDDEQ